MGVIDIQIARTSEQLACVRELFREYGELADVAPCVTAFASEIEGLPGQYADPEGLLLLAMFDGQGAGCVALRRIGDATGEIKRLYVRPSYRHEGIARMLVDEVIGHAFQRNYDRLYLDTLPAMKAARSLYKSYGFMPTEPYLERPTPGALCFELRLSHPGD